MKVEITCSIRKPLLQQLVAGNPTKFRYLVGAFVVLIFPWGIPGDQIYISEIQVPTIFCLTNNFVSLPSTGIFYFFNCS